MTTFEEVDSTRDTVGDGFTVLLWLWTKDEHFNVVEEPEERVGSRFPFLFVGTSVVFGSFVVSMDDAHYNGVEFRLKFCWDFLYNPRAEVSWIRGEVRLDETKCGWP